MSFNLNIFAKSEHAHQPVLDNELPQRAEEDLLHSLKRITSPISLNAIKHYILDRSVTATQAPSFWSHVQSIGMELVALTAVAGAITYASMRQAPNTPMDMHAVPATHTQASIVTSIPIVTGDHSQLAHAPSSVHEAIAMNSAALPEPQDHSRPIQFIPHIEENAVIAQPQSIDRHIEYRLLPEANDPAVSSWFVSAQTGATFDRMRMVTEGLMVGARQDWKSIALQYTATTGHRDNVESLAPPPDGDPLLQSEDRRQIALLLGATTNWNRFQGSAYIGPSYIFSTSKLYNTASHSFTGPVAKNSPGIATTISINYELTNFLSMGVLGFANVHSHWSGIGESNTTGLLLTVSIQP